MFNSGKGNGNHSSTLAWKIPWTEEPGRLQPMGSPRVGHDWATSLSRFGEGNGNPLQCSCLENPSDGGAWWAAVYGVAQSRTRLKQLSSMFNSLLLNDQLLEKKTYLIHLHTLRTEQTLAESVHNYYGHGNQISNLLELFCNQDNEVYDFLCTVLFFFIFFFLFFFFFTLFFLFVVDFVIHWNETAKGLHVFPIPIPPLTSLSTHSL